MAQQPKSYKKFVATAATATLVASAIVPVASANVTTSAFTDVAAQYKDAVDFVVSNSISAGYSKTQFGVNMQIDRGDAAVWIANAAGLMDKDAPAAGFSDVPTRGNLAVNSLKAAGVINGKTATNFGFYDKITRGEAAMMLQKAFDLKAGDTDSKFSDVAKKYESSVNALVANKVTNGTSATQFGTNNNIKRGDFAKFLFALKDKIAPDVVGVSSVTVSNPTTLSVKLKEAKQGLTAADFSVVVDGTVVVPTGVVADSASENYTLTIPTLDGNAGTVAVNKVEASYNFAKAQVSSVKAINASEVLVTFNTAIDAQTAKDYKNYEIKVNNELVQVANNQTTKDAITVSKDKKTAIIRLAKTFQNGDKYVVQTNDAIKSEDGKALAKFISEEAAFTESAAPGLLSVTPGTNSLTLEFDRPVKGMDSTLIKVDGYDIDGTATTTTPLTAVSNAAGNYKYTVNVTNADALAEAFDKGVHEVIAYDIQDTASAYPAKASVLTGSYTITDEVTVPEVKEVVEVNANKFFLRTNVPVDLSTAKLTVEKGNHEFKLVDGNFTNSNNPSGDVNSSKVDAEAGTYLNSTDHGVWVIITDSKEADENPLYKGSETSANLKVTLENFKDAKTKGLLGKKSVTNVTLNKNNSKPAVETTMVSGSKLVVDFGDALEAANTTFDKSDVVVRNKEGVIITGVSSATIVGDTVEVELGANHKTSDEPYSVEFKAGEFKYKEVNNSIENYLVNTIKNDKLTAQVYSTSTNFKYKELPLTVGTIANGQNVEIGSTVNGQDTITIDYKMDMDDSARSAANYQLDGKALPTGSTVDFVDNKKKVRIVLPEGSLKATTSYKLTVSTTVKTKEGSIIVGSLQTKAPAEAVINLGDNIAPTLTEAKFLRADEEVKPSTSTKQVELTFSEAVMVKAGSTTANLTDDLKVMVSGTEITIASIASDSKDNKRMIITLGQEINVSQAATITVVAEADQKGDKTTYIVDKAGNKAKAGSSVIATTSKFSASVGGTPNPDNSEQIKVDAANAALSIAKTEKTQVAKELAQTAINKLAEGTTKTQLQTELDAIVVEGDAVEMTVAEANGQVANTGLGFWAVRIPQGNIDTSKAYELVIGDNKFPLTFNATESRFEARVSPATITEAAILAGKIVAK
ncbi:S-layer homology domain-containing protein [Sporosarcina sp. BI001-red]|uniref:S-layer homology domain-containing protein n=1 Tax=Sporosarcina sp. BI001-red TaxID=2282866 RepID=UPI000E2396F8|nr:S-layer homology domain-containing protein [Sporosarcina sp. BI001-red]REB08531.1 S-layer homology domain-containing protein [Sporosarcina sp. BI001-red]